MSIDDLDLWDEIEEDNESKDLDLWGDLDDYFEDEIAKVIKYVYINNPKYSDKKNYIIYKN
ncbi:MAG: hypothetical protein AABW45_01910 [Nanoarchaeota archaeon]